jgi:hypothetical protein
MIAQASPRRAGAKPGSTPFQHEREDLMARKPIRRRPTPALVISVVALIVACAGTAVGATRYLITSPKQVKPGSITGAALRNGTITTGKLAGSTIAKLRATRTVVSFTGTVPASSTGTTVKVSCPSGQQASGGGYGNDGPTVLESRPDPKTGTPTSWVVTALNTTLVPAAQKQSVYVICAS